MERKHQVFVSSTYRDLIDERKEIIHALLELDCIPAGMELFPATDEDAWSLIKEVIDGCDYYLLAVGGKYGSTNPDGLGYTEMEYDYAVSKSKPMICFLHEDISSLSASKVESSDSGRERVSKFYEKIKSRHCKFWNGPADLGGKVSRSLIQLKKKHPSDGWVPGRYAIDGALVSEMERMRIRIIELEGQAALLARVVPPDENDLAGGDDVFLATSVINRDSKGGTLELNIEVTWDDLFRYCGPALSTECTAEQLLNKIQLCLYHRVPGEFKDFNDAGDVVVPYVVEDAILVQFQALRLIEPGTKKRAVSDGSTYWKLTSYGERHLIDVSAIRK